MTAMQTKHKIVKSTKNGQITIPIEFRKQLGAEGEGLWEITLENQSLSVVPVEPVRRSTDPHWHERLYELFAPARQEAIEQGYTDEEINQWIDDAFAEVRGKRND